MPGAMRKMAVYLGLVEDEDERYDLDGDDLDEPDRTRAAAEERPPAPVRTGSEARACSRSEPPARARAKRAGITAAKDSSRERPAYTPPSSGSSSRSVTWGPKRSST